MGRKHRIGKERQRDAAASLAVAQIACTEIGLGSTSICAALLHDVVEDAEISIEEVEEKFGKRVRELVESETEDKRADLPPSKTWRIRKEESLMFLKLGIR